MARPGQRPALGAPLAIGGALAICALVGVGALRAQSADPVETTEPGVPTPDPTPQEVAPQEAAPAPVEKAPPAASIQEAAKPAPQTPTPQKADVASDTPLQRQRHAAAVVQALDKITTESMRFELQVNRPKRYKGLVFTLRSCETTAEDEPMSDSVAFLEIRAEPRAQTEQQPSRQVFRGWMFASTPGVAALKHPIYDAWLIACKA